MVLPGIRIILGRCFGFLHRADKVVIRGGAVIHGDFFTGRFRLFRRCACFIGDLLIGIIHVPLIQYSSHGSHNGNNSGALQELLCKIIHRDHLRF